MPYDEGTAQRLRDALAGTAEVTEKKMFGGVCLMVRGNMVGGVVGTELMLRVGPDGYDDALAQPHAREMDFTGKPLKGMVYVGKAGFEQDADLDAWVSRALTFVGTLPAK